jgi:hypothetical protein
MTMPSALNRPSIADATHDVVASARRVMTAIVAQESERVEARFKEVWRASLLLVPLTVLATAAFVYLISGIENALTDAADWPLWSARITVAAVLGVFAALAGFLIKSKGSTHD